MKNVEYKGFIINPAPYQLTESGPWTLSLTITRHRDSEGETREKNFSTSDAYDSKEEAIQHSINFAKRIIDGEVKSCTVTDL